MNGPRSAQERVIAGRFAMNRAAMSGPERSCRVRQKQRTAWRFTASRSVRLYRIRGVLHEHRPAFGVGEFEPVLVGDGLIGRDAVMLGEGDQA